MATTTRQRLRIGGASGFWGDSSVGAPQLVASGEVDVLVFDYLAETTMALLVAAQRKNPALGYATDFVDTAMRQVLPEVLRQGIRVVANAGGINPSACAAALRELAASMSLAPRIAVVEGDDLRERLPALRTDPARWRDLDRGEPLPDKLASANVYLGAEPIARALDAGAEIVITGRCVDSALALGPLIHALGWRLDDFDRLAAGSLAGHLIECGAQATGGLFTDWESVPDWAGIGYPIVECLADGRFTLTKPPGTGGLVTTATVGEQLLYEIGDPGAYQLPDVTCDFRQVRIVQSGPDRVEVSSAQGRPPPPALKVSATALRGWRCTGTLTIVGLDAEAKARRSGEAILARCRRLFAERGWDDFAAVRLGVLGPETLYGPRAQRPPLREVQMRLAVQHRRREALELFAREIAPAGTSWSPGTTGSGGGRPSVSPLIQPLGFAIDRAEVMPKVRLDDLTIDVPLAATAAPTVPPPLPDPPPWEPVGPTVELPLVRLAWARSGDKGDRSNIGVIARRPEWLPLLWAQLTPQAVKGWLGHLVKGRVERHHLPGLNALNLVLDEALDGGGPVSLRIDPLGKAMAQMLLELPIAVPKALADELGPA